MFFSYFSHIEAIRFPALTLWGTTDSCSGRRPRCSDLTFKQFCLAPSTRCFSSEQTLRCAIAMINTVIFCGLFGLSFKHLSNDIRKRIILRFSVFELFWDPEKYVTSRKFWWKSHLTVIFRRQVVVLLNILNYFPLTLPWQKSSIKQTSWRHSCSSPFLGN